MADMHPFFAAMGPSFKKGSKVTTFNIVDVYPMLCTILGLKPALNNGSMDVVTELLVDRLKENTGKHVWNM
ncbi:hypothetical protein DPMN_052656 [Dreissena polymorpha]|uniref:Uncharacterized protein n=1 Tax=Dreissena polymorpha TaxID=45954 RepID=A0A9D4CLN5_DREPO|nr:hypothetical protein DPMN_052656 [Dreissena polymorpha]